MCKILRACYMILLKKARTQRLQRSCGIIRWSVTSLFAYRAVEAFSRFRVSASLNYYKPFFAGLW